MERRKFLTGSLLLGCSAAASPLMAPMSFAAMPQDSRFVVILLRGGMDGLDVVQPYGDKNIRRLRPGFKIGPQNGAIWLDNFYSMHPALSPLRDMWNRGELGFAHAVSTPYRDKRSHFDGQDILEAGIGNAAPVNVQQTGWLNRLLSVIPYKSSNETAYYIGADEGRILQGLNKYSTWVPDLSLGMSETGLTLLRNQIISDPMFLNAFDIGRAVNSQMKDITAAKSDAERVAALVANRLKGKSRIASFSINGWDTHANQSSNISKSLDQLATTLLFLKKNLGSVWGRTVVLAMTEFGRTARENGSGGTDHGTGGALIMAGGAIRGKKIYGKWPGLEQLYKDRDLLPTDDIRNYPAWALRSLFGVSQANLERTVFPGLRMGANPRFTL